MQLGIHLPQYGRAAAPEAIGLVAQRAEALGMAGVWVSDHVIRPAAQEYPSAHLYDPLLTLAWAAATTERIGIGTSVLVVPQHNPLWLAKALASLDALSGGRLTLAAGVGWSRAEFELLGQSFGDRGQRTDEILEALRVCWEQDPATYRGRHVAFEDVRVLPQPAHRIPIWVGGGVPAAHRRAVEHGDGFHAISVTPDELAPVARTLREQRPDPDDFVISLRTGWDPQGMDPVQIRDERAAYAEAGVQYVVAAPWRTDAEAWVRSMEQLAELVEPDPPAQPPA